MKHSRKVETLLREYAILQKRYIQVLNEVTDLTIERDNYKRDAKFWNRVAGIYLFCHLLWLAARYGVDLIFK